MNSKILTFSALLLATAIVAMGYDNAAQLERCEASGRSVAECQLLVLGR